MAAVTFVKSIHLNSFQMQRFFFLIKKNDFFLNIFFFLNVFFTRKHLYVLKLKRIHIY